MKTVKIILALVVAVVIFNSCKKDYAEPTIAWTPDSLSQPVIFENNTTWNKTLSITFAAEAGISEIKIWKHVYMAGEVNPTSVILESPTGYSSLTTFDYEFATAHTASDFEGGVSKIVYEFEVTDASETPQQKAKEYNFLVEDVFTVTLNVKNEQGDVITDAIVTFAGVEKTEGPYVFNYVAAGTYTYSVEKAGYTTINVTGYELTEDATIDAVLVANLSDWSAEIPLALYGTTGWASYNNGVAVTNYFSNVIGMSFNYTDANSVRIDDVDHSNASIGCDGWVVVTDISNLTTQGSLSAAFNAGTILHTYNLPYDDTKAYAPVYFISKMGSTYKLVYYVAGHRNTTTGNVVVFKYKS